MLLKRLKLITNCYNQLLKEILLNLFGISQEDLIQEYGQIDVSIATNDEYIKYQWMGLHSAKSEADAAEHEGSLLLINLECFHYDEIEDITESGTLYNNILRDVYINRINTNKKYILYYLKIFKPLKFSGFILFQNVLINDNSCIALFKMLTKSK